MKNKQKTRNDQKVHQRSKSTLCPGEGLEMCAIFTPCDSINVFDVCFYTYIHIFGVSKGISIISDRSRNSKKGARWLALLFQILLYYHHFEQRGFRNNSSYMDPPLTWHIRELGPSLPIWTRLWPWHLREIGTPLPTWTRLWSQRIREFGTAVPTWTACDHDT